MGLASQPQWLTGPRLLRLGEDIEFRFSVPDGGRGHELLVYPRYLEQTEPGATFTAGGSLEWVKTLPAEVLELDFVDGQASVTYTPSLPGSYLATWSAGGEAFSRYFSVIEDDWIVLRFSTFVGLDPDPTLHATGIPLDYRLPAERFNADDALFTKLLEYHRRFGDAIIPVLPDTPDITMEERLRPLGGTIRFESTPGAGTTVFIEAEASEPTT